MKMNSVNLPVDGIINLLKPVVSLFLTGAVLYLGLGFGHWAAKEYPLLSIFVWN
jgi:hypothetical protein